jgi:ABC-type branched-subunit amino acid transport system substrate-binding protein
MRGRLVLLVLVVGLVGLTACGSSSKKSENSSSSTTVAHSTEPGKGVTADAIKVGIPLSDFDCITQFVDKIRENQDKVYQIFIDDVNNNGGINGRKIEPVFHKFCPIPNAALMAKQCTGMTQDDKVFAVFGNFYDPTGNAQTCVAKTNNTPLMAYMLTDDIISNSPPGMMVFPGASPERIGANLIDLMTKQKLLDGKKVAMLGEPGTKTILTKHVKEALDKAGVQQGTTAILQISGADTTAAQSQLDSFIDRWKSEGTNAIFVSGAQVGDNQFMDKIRKELPDVMLLTDTTDLLRYGQEEKAAGTTPNAYEGMYSATGQTAQEYTDGPNWKACVDIYKKATGKAPPNQADVIKLPNGKLDDTYGTVNDACQMVNVFKQIATKVGKDLNVANWRSTVNSYGPITNLGGGQYASLRDGKWDIDDTFRLSQFDSSIGKQGDWKALTDLQNISGS